MPPYFDDSNSSNISLHLAGLHLDEKNNSRRKRTASSSGGRSETNSTQTRRLLSLPASTLDENRDIRSDLTLEKVLDEGLILAFAMDKAYCQ
ncbi:hypothetical protein B9Z55_004475 [Caenorhabditis nigoni]|uniref:Uncharacterized protein n=1 Tax=Caenorhabditis nigoni TaxID=1611254 RepID=A0A2G5UWQ5_9PELO|nr:hypothetical protein B9Z55_004475 [Caenorhabditis nigoni]